MSWIQSINLSYHFLFFFSHEKVLTLHCLELSWMVSIIIVYSVKYFSPKQIDELMNGFRLQDETYEVIMRLLEEEMNKGLRKQSHNTSTVRMYPTYVRSLPDGTGTHVISIWFSLQCSLYNKHTYILTIIEKNT